MTPFRCRRWSISAPRPARCSSPGRSTISNTRADVHSGNGVPTPAPVSMSDPERAWRTAYRHPTAWETHFPPQTMLELFDQALAQAAARPLLHFLGRTYSCAETLDGANRVAIASKAMGYDAGTRIGALPPAVPTSVDDHC